MNRMKKMKWLLVVEILIFIAMGITLIVRLRLSQDIDVSITDWNSDCAVYDDINGWYIDEELLQTDEKINLVYGPLISLKRGTYRILMDYSCDYDQSCLAHSENDSFHLKAGRAILSRNYDHLSYDFEVKEEVRDFEFLVEYDGKGYLQITHIDIAPSPFGFMRSICTVVCFFVCLDLCLLWSDKIKKNKNTLLALLGIVLLTSLPLFTDGIGTGDDLPFHLMRIEGIAREIRMGNIPVKVSSAWMDGYGYPVSVYYGDLLLYISAVMSLVGFSITAAYKFYIFMINAGTAFITYLCMNTICKNKRAALLACLAYCTASYRMVNIYVRAAVGEYSAMMFMPIVAAAVYKIYTDDISNVKEYRKNALLLAIGMSGLIGTHILSTEMIVVMMVLVCVSLFKLTFRKETVRVYLSAILETCVLSAYFIVPFLDYTINVPSKVSVIVARGESGIQNLGMTISEYFSFFRHIQHGNIDIANQRMLLTPGIILTVTFIAAIILWINNRGNATMKLLVVYACLTIIISLNIFPWDYLASHYRLGNLLAQVQFPWRYISILTIILTVLLGGLLVLISADKAKLMQAERAIVIAGFVMTCFFTADYIDGSTFSAPYCSAELDHYYVGLGEYLRGGTDGSFTSRGIFSTLSADVLSERMQEVTIVSRRGSSMQIRCVASDEEGWIWIPVFNYKGYHVTDVNGNEYPIKDNVYKQIEVSVPIGFDGYLQVEYREPWYWRLAEAISLLSVLGLCIAKGAAVRRKVAE